MGNLFRVFFRIVGLLVSLVIIFIMFTLLWPAALIGLLLYQTNLRGELSSFEAFGGLVVAGVANLFWLIAILRVIQYYLYAPV